MFSKTLLVVLVVYVSSNFSHGQRDKKFFRKDYNYIEAVDSFYKIHLTEKTWQDAKRECALEGASLYYPDSRDEANAVIAFWNTTYPNTYWTVSVGLTDLMTEGVFETIDGKSISEVYNQWQHGEPNNDLGVEDCVQLDQQGYTNDVPCDFTYRFICKKSFPSTYPIERNCSSNIQQSNLDGQRDKTFFRKDYNYIEAVNSFYKIHLTEKTWLDAKHECALEGASLYYPESKDEANAVIAFWNTTYPNTYWTVSVGLTDLMTEGIFETIDGKSISEVYNQWQHGEPNNDLGVEDCVQLNQQGYTNDVPCDYTYRFICKKSFPPTYPIERNCSSNIQQSNLDKQNHQVSFREDYTYIKAEESFYKIHTTQKNWRDAKRECALEGASLFYPENSDEANAVISFWKLSQTNFTRVFVGISDIITEGDYETIDGKSIPKWYDHLLVDLAEQSDDQDCMQLNQDGFIDVIRCDAEFSFICKKSSPSQERNCSSNIQQSNLDGQKNQVSFREDYIYIEAEESFYKIHTTQKNWRDAKRECALEGASLFYPENSDEANAVISFWKRIKTDFKWVFVGISDIITEGVYETIDGKSISDVYNTWGPNQPDNSGDEDCLQLNQEGMFNDIDCGAQFSFFCKKSLPSLERNCTSNIQQSDLDTPRNKTFFRKDYTYIVSEESFYKVHKIAQSFADAKRICALEGASMFYAENEDEAKAVMSFMNRTNPTIPWVFVGLSDIMAEGLFETVDKRLITEVYSNWQISAPDNIAEEDCVHMDVPGTMNDISCDYKSSFICKKSLKSLEWNYDCNMPNLDYTFNNNTSKCYKLHTTPLNWTEASAMCRIEYTSLAVISNRMEADYLEKLTKSTPKPHINEQYQRGIYHLGFHNRFNEGWQTVGGTPMNVDADLWFDKHQPDRNHYEECGSMFFNGRLINTNCNTKSMFICEHEVDSSN